MNQPSSDSAPPPALAVESPDPEKKKGWKIPLAVGLGTAVSIALGQGLFAHGTANKAKSLDATPRSVSVIAAQAAPYHKQRRFVGTVQPWVAARIGPQIIAAYVKDVLVRPGAVVKAGDLLATLDCRSASASARALEEQAKAIDQMQAAMQSEAKHMGNLAGTGYVSDNEVLRHNAQSMAEAARGAAARAQLAGTTVAVGDCTLRAPFSGEVGGRYADPGAFASPGARLLTLVDRNVVRVVVNVPETDFSAVAPGTPVRIRFLSSEHEVTATVTRRSPEADPVTRTAEVEIDLPNADHSLPTNTTAELWVDVSKPVEASRIPLSAANVKADKAKLFVIEHGVARQKTFPVLGEADGQLFLDRTLAGAQVVTQGRTGLHDGDKVDAHAEAQGS